jgi:hypothetical protein
VRDLIEIVADAAELDVKAGQIDPPVHRGRPGERRLAWIHGRTQPGRNGTRIERGTLGGGEASLQGNLIVDVGASLCDAVIDLLADAHARLAETPLTIVTPVVLSGADNRKSLAHLAKIAGALDALELGKLRRVLIANRVTHSDAAIAAFKELARWAGDHGFSLCQTLVPDAAVFGRGATDGYDLKTLAATDTGKLEQAAAKYLDAGDFAKLTETGARLTAILEAQRLSPLLERLAREIAGAQGG